MGRSVNSGFGQKAVFHLCDAFVVHAFGSNAPFRDVVNPFEDVAVDANVTGDWKTLSESDAALLRKAAAEPQNRGLILWLPFRRDALRPAPEAGFSSNQPDTGETIGHMDRPDDLRSLLTALRHLKRIELLESGEARRAVEVNDEERLFGPEVWSTGTRAFSGAIRTDPGGSKALFVGREATVWNDRLKNLRDSGHWPKTYSALRSTPTPEKGKPHGAATLLISRIESQKTVTRDPSPLTISWAVFLPVSETDGVEIPVATPALGRIQLLLHGYFFLDTGRRHIEGLDESASAGEPSDAAGLRVAWNAELRDSVVLPLVPALLYDAVDRRRMTSAELDKLTAGIANHAWFERHRRAICKHHALARVLDVKTDVTWCLVPAGATMRPLPQSVANHPERVHELCGSLRSWARETGVFLYVDGTALTAQPSRWTTGELGFVFSRVSSRVFHSRPLAALLADLLQLVEPSDVDRQEIAPHIIHVLRSALRDKAPLAPSGANREHPRLRS